MKIKDYLYIFLILVFAVLSYVFFDFGFNAKTKNYVTYNEKSDVLYRVHSLDNKGMPNEYLNMGDRYTASNVSDIEFKFNYKNTFSRNINGYYVYGVNAYLVAYKNGSSDVLFDNEDTLLADKTVILDKNNDSTIEIDDVVKVDYNKYRTELDNFISKYNVDIDANLELTFILRANLEFRGLNDTVTDNKIIKVSIPMSQDTFRIAINGDNDREGKYTNFSTKERANYFFIVLGALAISIAITILILFIRRFIIIWKEQTSYQRELDKIFREYDDIIIKVKRFYNKKKYNLIYVDSFNDILDVYNKTESPINFREIKKDKESMFIIIDDDSAWIYKLESNDKK